MIKIGIKTLGCNANQADTLELLKIDPTFFKFQDIKEKSDIYILNTCAVTHKALQESKRLARKIKKQAPSAILIVTGCGPVIEEKEIKDLGADYIFAGSKPKEIKDFLLDRYQIKQSHIRYGPGLGGKTRGWLKIQEGCECRCSFCIVPLVRGKQRSMPEKEVLQRLKQMKDFGYKEVILCGINLGAWGKDLGSNFTSLIKKIDQEIPLFRIRLSSIEPMEITDELIDIIASSNMICPHLHLPLQSGDDEILKAMRRNYTSSEYFSLANRLLDKIKDLALGIDVIVGYPGESLAHFKRTQALLEKLEFMYLHVFPFSSRPGTLAQYIRSNLSAQEIKTRVHILRELSKEKKKRFISNYIGKSMEVLFDKVISYNQGIIRGITRNYIFVQVKAKREFIYKIGWVKILGIDSDLNAIGQLVSINNT